MLAYAHPARLTLLQRMGAEGATMTTVGCGDARPTLLGDTEVMTNSAARFKHETDDQCILIRFWGRA